MFLVVTGGPKRTVWTETREHGVSVFSSRGSFTVYPYICDYMTSTDYTHTKNQIFGPLAELRGIKKQRFKAIQLRRYVCLSLIRRVLFFAGSKRGRPCLGFPDLVRTSVRTSIRPSVRPSPFGLILSYKANIPRTPNIFTDSSPPIK